MFVNDYEGGNNLQPQVDNQATNEKRPVDSHNEEYNTFDELFAGIIYPASHHEGNEMVINADMVMDIFYEQWLKKEQKEARIIEENLGKDNQGDWEEMSLEQTIEQLVLDMTGAELGENHVRDYLRELLKKQKSEIIVKAEGYRNSYDALGKFIEDLSNS